MRIVASIAIAILLAATIRAQDPSPGTGAGAGAGTGTAAGDGAEEPSKFFSPEDGWLDLSGLRYEIAREYGIHIGLDVAVGPEEDAFYVTFGSAWARP